MSAEALSGFHISGATATPGEQAPPGPLAGLGIVALVPLVVMADTYLNAVFGLTDLWAGFLFVTIWMATGKVQAASFASCAIGSLIGALMALMLQVVPPLYGTAGMIVTGAIIFAVIYLLIIGRAKLMVNFSTMTFLTVCAAAQIQQHANMRAVLAATTIGIVFFGALLFGQKKVLEIVAAKRASTAVAS